VSTTPKTYATNKLYVIEAAVKARLEAVTIGNGFQTAPTTLFVTPPSDDTTDAGPWLVYRFNNEELVDVAHGGQYTMAATFVIDGYFKRTSSMTDRQVLQYALKLLQDLRTTISGWVEIFQLAGAIQVQIGSMIRDDGFLSESSGLVMFSQPVVLTYKNIGAW